MHHLYFQGMKQVIFNVALRLKYCAPENALQAVAVKRASKNWEKEKTRKEKKYTTQAASSSILALPLAHISWFMHRA